MTVTSDERDRLNLFAKEPQMYITPEDMEKNAYQTHNERAELLNGRLAMVSLSLAAISYVFTGTLAFGLF